MELFTFVWMIEFAAILGCGPAVRDWLERRRRERDRPRARLLR